jgi:acetyl esterase/lipase
MSAVPWGGLLLAWCAAMAVSPIRRPRPLAVASWILAMAPSELPLLFIVIVAASTTPDLLDGGLASPSDWASLAVMLVTIGLLLIVARRAFTTRRTANRALAAALGARWRDELAPPLAGRLRRRLPWARILLLPWPFPPRDVKCHADIPYGPDGASNLLDVYRHRSHPSPAPTLIYFHGGRFRHGRKNWEARPLLHHLARQGWTCISANYHLTRDPAAGFPQHLIDVKQVIAWARTHGHEHGIDPATIFLAGSSAGAHLTAMAALTANEPRFQPGFETIDTSIVAGVGLYGYYGQLGGDEDPPTTPLAYLTPDVPPMFIVHGDNDTYTPVEGARLLVDRLRATSTNPVAYAELHGAQHSFDMFHSIRFEMVVDAIEAFSKVVRTRQRGGPPWTQPSSRSLSSPS